MSQSSRTESQAMTSKPALTSAPSTEPSSRRRLMAGAGTVGALAAAAAVLPSLVPQAPVAQASAQPPRDTDAGGYQLTDHVRRYYQTTRV